MENSPRSEQISDIDGDDVPPVVYVKVILVMALSSERIAEREYKLSGETHETSLGSILGWAREVLACHKDKHEVEVLLGEKVRCSELPCRKLRDFLNAASPAPPGCSAENCRREGRVALELAAQVVLKHKMPQFAPLPRLGDHDRYARDDDA